MNTTTTSPTMYRIDAINNIQVPIEHSKRATMWKMAHAGELVESSIVLRAIALCDIKESPDLIEDLYNQYRHLLQNKDIHEQLLYLMAILSLQEIADFFGY